MTDSFVKFATDFAGIITAFMERPASECTLAEVLDKMAEQGQSVLLNWGEDDRLWECSWITGGKRYTSHAAWIGGAVAGCIAKVLWEADHGAGQAAL